MWKNGSTAMTRSSSPTGWAGAIEERRHGDQEPGPGVLQLEREPVRRVEGIDGRVHPARGEHTEVGHGVLREVRAEQADHVAPAEATGREARGGAPDHFA